MNEQALTLDEAIEKGYKYCAIEESEGIIKRLTDLKSNPEIWDPLETTYYLCGKEPSYHSVDAKSIEELIQENIDCQDEFYTEDGFDDAMEGCDELLKQLADQINSNLHKHKFYFTGEIKLLPNH